MCFLYHKILNGLAKASEIIAAFAKIQQNLDLLIAFLSVCNTIMNVFPLYFFDVPSLVSRKEAR